MIRLPTVILKSIKVFIIAVAVSQTALVNSLCEYTESSKEPSEKWIMTVHSL